MAAEVLEEKALHCTAYALVPHSLSPHNVLHSASSCIIART